MLVYCITNKITNKKYVGQTAQSLEKRVRGHRFLSSATYKNMPIAWAIQKYGWDNFSVEILCECNSREELNIKEVEFVIKLDTMVPQGYNLRAGGGVVSLVSEALKEKMRSRNLGKKASEESKKRMSEAHQGQTLSEVNKEKLRQMYKGQKLSDLAYQNALKATVKTYQFLNPAGEPQTVTNLREFCRVQDLNYLSMHKVAAGRRKSHKGWSKFSGKNFV